MWLKLCHVLAFPLSVQGGKEQGRNLRCSPLQDTCAMQHHGTELNWATSKSIYTASPTVESLMPWHLKLTSNLFYSPPSSKQKEKQEGNNRRNAEKQMKFLILCILWDWILVLRQGPMDARKLSWALTVLCWLLYVSKDVKNKEKWP